MKFSYNFSGVDELALMLLAVSAGLAVALILGWCL